MIRTGSALSLSLAFLRFIPFAEADQTTDNHSYDEETPEAMVMAVFSLMFAICISMIGVAIGYFSILEDLLMRRYNREGVLVRADVVMVDFARGTSVSKDACGCSQSDAQKQVEYTAQVEYRQVQTERNITIVRKQVKAMEADFVWPEIPSTVKVQAEDTSNNEPLSIDGPRQIQVLVIPSNPSSGIPKFQVERIASWKYRIPTTILILFVLAFACFSLSLGLRANEGLHDHFWSLFVSILVADTFIVHLLLRNVFTDALQSEYLDGGEIGFLKGDDTTLSSRTDSFLFEAVA